MQPPVFLVSSPHIKIETPPSLVNPARLFSCLLKLLPSFLPSLSVLSPCASLSGVQPTAFPHQKLTFPVIQVLDRFPILFTFCAPILSRKENVNEQELNETHKPGEFVSEGMGEGTEGDGKMKTLTSAKSDMYWHLQIKLSNHEILSLENKIHIQNPNQNIFSPVYKICF